MGKLTAAGYPLLAGFVTFIKERESIRLKKEAGKKAPWTKDAILNTYRFCNIHREDDRVTRELKALAPKGEQDLWFWWVVARLLNLPSSVEAVQDVILPWKPEKFRQILHKRKSTGKNNFNAAYIVSTNGVAMDKVDYLVTHVLGPMWADRAKLRPTINDDLFGWHARLCGYNGFASFMAAQVVADMKYAEPLKNAVDWNTFAASGPGSRRGLNRVMGVAPEASWRAGAWNEALDGLAAAVRAPLAKVGIHLHNQDLQNCLCEFSKYARMKYDNEPPKQLYREHDG